MLNLRQVSREEAGQLLRAAHQRNPSHQETARRLARYLFASDAIEELVTRFRPVLETAELDPECLHYLGLAATLLGDEGLAEAALSRAVSRGYADSLGPWASTLHDLQRTAEAYSVATRALEQNPEDDRAGQIVSKTMLADGRYSELWNLWGRLRVTGRWTPRVVSVLAHAARTFEQQAFVRRITDKNIWFERKTIQFEPSWMHQLVESLRFSDRWTPLPRAKATIGSGRRIEAAHAVVGNPWLDTLFQHIRAAVADYVARREDLLGAPPEDQPMAAMKPDTPALTSWVVSVNGEGHEDWHIHPDGWLSGVFYVEVPDLAASEAPHAGQIEFGPLPFGAPTSLDAWPAWMLQPRAGDLMLFPSYFAHRTWPTQLAQDRICIAFDVLRQGVASAMAASPRAGVPTAIHLDERIARDARAISVPDTGGCGLVMNVDSGQCVAMDDTGALIWSLLETPRTAREIACIVVREFEGSETDIQRDISAALGQMVNCGLAVVA